MGKLKNLLIEVQEARPDLSEEEIEEVMQWLKINYNEAESLTSAVNRYFAHVH